MGLLDHRGNPLAPAASSTFKKAPSPIMGEKFGDWQGSNRTPMTSLMRPGFIQFNLDQLTIADYRLMRDHYQVNASLSVLTFMLYQMDWKLEGGNAKAVSQCEENLREVWTRLVRAMSQSFWAGYSPNVLQWENDVSGRATKLTKIKDLLPEDCTVHWKTVNGYKPPGATIPKKLKIYDGIDQWGWGHIPVENSLWYPLLMENGNMYGRKILRSAFVSYFFSILMHLFANRYFERFGEPVPVGRAPFDAEITSGESTMNGGEYMENALYQLRSRSVVTLPSDRDPETKEFDYDIQYLECVDESTEIFTKQGWQSWDTVTEDDETLTLNHVTGQSEWQKIQKISMAEVEDKPMLWMDSMNHSSVTTLNHRWPVLNRHVPQLKAAPGGLKVAYDSREWRFSKDLKQADSVPIQAERADYPTEQKYEDAFVELVAWYWTEGYLFKTGKYVSIHQKRYPEKIRSALTRLFGEPTSNFAKSVGSTALSGTPMWRENGKTHDEANRQFFLNYEATSMLNEVAPKKIVTREFILSLTKSQLDLYIQTALLADGNVTSRQVFLMQKSRQMAEMFEFACLQNGYATSFYKSKPDSRFPADEGMWVVSIKRSKVFKPINQSKQIINYSGMIWCPTTPNGSWLARRDGRVFFTGNSQMRGADFDRYLMRLDEEVSLAIFTPLLMLRSGETGSTNLGLGQMQVYLWMLNAIAGDWAEYINRYILKPMTALNGSMNMAEKNPVKIRFRKMGKENVETLRTVLNELMTQGKVGVDIQELGQATGMTLTEIKQVTDPGGDPQKDDRVARDRPDKATPAGVGDPGATAGDVTARVQRQVEKAFRLGTYGEDFKPTLGYHRQLREAFSRAGYSAEESATRVNEFYGKMDRWLDDVIPAGTSVFSTPEEFMTGFQKMLDSSLEQAVR